MWQALLHTLHHEDSHNQPADWMVLSPFFSYQGQTGKWLPQMCPDGIWPQLNISDSRTHILLLHHTASKPNFSLDLWSDWSGSLFKICTMPMFRRKWGPATCSLLLSQHPSLPCQSQWHHNVIIPYRKDSLCGSFKTVNYSLWKTQAAWIHAHKRFSDAHYLGLFSP